MCRCELQWKEDAGRQRNIVKRHPFAWSSETWGSLDWLPTACMIFPSGKHAGLVVSLHSQSSPLAIHWLLAVPHFTYREGIWRAESAAPSARSDLDPSACEVLTVPCRSYGLQGTHASVTGSQSVLSLDIETSELRDVQLSENYWIQTLL